MANLPPETVNFESHSSMEIQNSSLCECYNDIRLVFTKSIFEQTNYSEVNQSAEGAGGEGGGHHKG